MKPLIDDIITVKYDSRIPIKLFAGDTTIGENVFALIDGTTRSDGVALNQFELSMGFPYYLWVNGLNYHVPRNATSLVSNKIEDNKIFFLDAIRQLIIMFCCETKKNTSFLYAIDSSGTSNSQIKSFPEINYIQRPTNWNYKDLCFDPRNLII